MSQVQTLDTFIEREMAAVAAIGLMMGAFGVLALILSFIGIWGVMAHSIAQRNREIGIRMALGAKSGQVMRLVLRHGVIQAGLGILIGTPLAFLVREASRGVAVDFQVSLGSPVLMVGLGALLAVVCLLASYLPARRALHVHPAIALRDQ